MTEKGKRRRRRRTRERTRGRFGPTLFESVDREPVPPLTAEHVAIARDDADARVVL